MRTKAAGEAEAGAPKELSQRQPMSDMPGILPNGTTCLRTSSVRSHLRSSGEQEEPKVLVIPHAKVLLQTDGTRQMSLCLPIHPLRVQASEPEGRMEVSSLSDKFDTGGLTAFPGPCHGIHTTQPQQCPEELVRQLGTLPAPVLPKTLHPIFMDPLTTFVYYQNIVSPSKKHFVISFSLLFLFLFG